MSYLAPQFSISSIYINGISSSRFLSKPAISSHLIFEFYHITSCKISQIGCLSVVALPQLMMRPLHSIITSNQQRRISSTTCSFHNFYRHLSSSVECSTASSWLSYYIYEGLQIEIEISLGEILLCCDTATTWKGAVPDSDIFTPWSAPSSGQERRERNDW